MSILGMGPLEILVILLVGFVLLGPERMVEAARLVGKATREIRRMADELPRLDLDDSGAQTYVRPIVPPVGGAPPSVSEPASQDRQGEGVAKADPGDEGPVQFQSSRAGNESDEDSSQEKDRDKTS